MPLRRPRLRAFRPTSECLEERQMLSQTVSGIDADGDKWILSLIGPGSLRVTNQNSTPLTQPAEIDTILISGTSNFASRLVGTVVKSANGDGKVFFDKLIANGGGRLPEVDPTKNIGLAPAQNGLLGIDMPDFWLGYTGTATPPAFTSLGPTLGNIPNSAAAFVDIPDGVTTLRFGGADATFAAPGATPLNQTGQNNALVLHLGLPVLGTSVIANKFVSTAQAATTAGSPAFQDAIYVLTDGRMNLFQANSIEGNASLAPRQFADTTPSPLTAGTTGGTVVASVTNFNVPGQIGDIRVGGDATNFTALVDNALGETVTGSGQALSEDDAKLANFSIGGETNNVLVVAPGGLQNVAFGKGMDKVKINAKVIGNLTANRDTNTSSVTINRTIDRFQVGGDVLNTNIQSGYSQGNNVIADGALFNANPVPTITNRIGPDNRGTFSPVATNGGGITALIGGNVINSVISASVEPNPADDGKPGVFGDFITLPSGKQIPNDLILPHGEIHAKVEGNIDNSNNSLVDPASADKAFFANFVSVQHGPIIPPTVPEAPYAHPAPIHQGQTGLAGPRLQAAIHSLPKKHATIKRTPIHTTGRGK